MAQSAASGKSDFQGDSRTGFKTPPKGTAVDVDADQIVFDDRAKTAVATGNVVLTYGDYVLIARRVTYNQATDTMRAEGEIRMREPGGNILEADVLELAEPVP
jgi:LPS-assembly protein